MDCLPESLQEYEIRVYELYIVYPAPSEIKFLTIRTPRKALALTIAGLMEPV